MQIQHTMREQHIALTSTLRQRIERAAHALAAATDADAYPNISLGIVAPERLAEIAAALEAKIGVGVYEDGLAIDHVSAEIRVGECCVRVYAQAHGRKATAKEIQARGAK